MIRSSGAAAVSAAARSNLCAILSYRAQILSSRGSQQPPTRCAIAKRSDVHATAPMVLTESQRAALRMLAGSPSGYALLTITARGVPIEVLQDLVRMSLTTAQRRSFGRRSTKIMHLRITAAGRKAIAEY